MRSEKLGPSSQAAWLEAGDVLMVAAANLSEQVEIAFGGPVRQCPEHL